MWDGVRPRLLLLIPTKSYRASDFLRAAETLDVEVVVGSNRRQVLEKFSQGRTLTLNFCESSEGCRQIAQYAKRYPLRAVIPTDDDTTVLAALASHELDLAHNAPESVSAARDKFLMRETLAKRGVLSPKFKLLSIHGDPMKAARESRYPCVLKPRALAASRGVIRVNNRREFINAFQKVAQILSQPDELQTMALREDLLVEDYIPGTEYALEGLLRSGRLEVLALFDKPDPLKGPFFEETIYVTPSRLPPNHKRAVIQACRTALVALGLREGPVHVEVRLNKSGAWVIEVAARSIGGLCSRVLRFGAGMSLEELILRHALGLPVATLRRERSAAGVMMIPIPKAGVLRAVQGVEDARRVPGVEGVTLSIPLGQEVIPLPEGGKYLGFIFAKGRDPRGVEAALRQAHRKICFAIAP